MLGLTDQLSKAVVGFPHIALTYRFERLMLEQFPTVLALLWQTPTILPTVDLRSGRNDEMTTAMLA